MTHHTYRRAISPHFIDSIPIISHLRGIGRIIRSLYCQCTGNENGISKYRKAKQWYHEYRSSKKWTVEDDKYIKTVIAVAQYTPIRWMYDHKAKRVLRTIIGRCFVGDKTPPCLEACREAEYDERVAFDPWRIYTKSMKPGSSNHELFVDVIKHRGKLDSSANGDKIDLRAKELYQEFWVEYRECQSCLCLFLEIFLL